MKNNIEHYENRAGGKGTMHIERLLSQEQFGQNIKMFAKVTIDVNSSLGLHPHSDDGEAYYILKGTGMYNDNGKTRVVQAGDLLFTPPGKSHGIENIGEIPFVFMAIIIREAHKIQT